MHFRLLLLNILLLLPLLFLLICLRVPQIESNSVDNDNQLSGKHTKSWPAGVLATLLILDINRLDVPSILVSMFEPEHSPSFVSSHECSAYSEKYDTGFL